MRESESGVENRIPWILVLTAASIAAILLVVAWDTIGVYVLLFPALAAVVVWLSRRHTNQERAVVGGLLTLVFSFLLYPVALFSVLIAIGLFGGL